MREWPFCVVPKCTNRCCLALDSVYCWPHTQHLATRAVKARLPGSEGPDYCAPARHPDSAGYSRNITTVGGLEMHPNQFRASGIDTAAELKRCPFCDHEAGYYQSSSAGDRFPIGVTCTNTSCGVKTPQHYQSRELAAAAWNRRAEVK